MFSKTIAVGYAVLTVVLGSSTLLSQTSPGPPNSPSGREFPVIMRQNVIAGKTPVGTKVQANLVVATLVDGVVIPRDALLSGQVTESVAKSKSDPSRLGIRMDSAQWKNGAAPIKVYLTSWYYPVAATSAQDLSYQPPGAAQSVRRWNGMGTYPDKNAPPDPQPLPGPDRDSSPATASMISKHRVLMKDVDATSNPDGSVTLTTMRFNLKLDKVTTYVLAAGGLVPTNHP
jgi:hypothetical protein